MTPSPCPKCGSEGRETVDVHFGKVVHRHHCDEIATLRAQVAGLEDWNAKIQRERAMLEAEVKQLQQALYDLLDESSDYGGCYCMGPTLCGRCESRKKYWKLLPNDE